MEVHQFTEMEGIWREKSRNIFSHYDSNPVVCWRNCENQNANHQHVFWDCSVIKDYSRGIHNVLQDIFEFEIPYANKTIYFGYIPKKWLRGDTPNECTAGSW